MAILSRGMYETDPEINFSEMMESFNRSRFEAHREMMLIMESAMEADIFIEESVLHGLMEAEEADKESDRSKETIIQKIKNAINKLIDALKTMINKFMLFIEQALGKNAVKKYGEEFFENMNIFEGGKSLKIGVSFNKFKSADTLDKLIAYTINVSRIAAFFKSGYGYENKIKETIEKTENPITYINSNIESVKEVNVTQEYVNDMVQDIKNIQTKKKDLNEFINKTNKSLDETIRVIKQIKLAEPGELKLLEMYINDIMKAFSIYANTVNSMIKSENALLLAVARYAISNKSNKGDDQ